MPKRIGFVINPIAGMGGRVGLKGTDGVLDEARRLGAQPVAQTRARAALALLARHLAKAPASAPRWLTCAGAMGEAALREAELDDIEIVHTPGAEPTAHDTRQAVIRFLEKGVDLILFCGGDGTARDICEVAAQSVPLLGIPSGVKMYSGVFGTSPERTAETLLGFLEDRLDTAPADILDIDEADYRADNWRVRLYHAALTPYEPTHVQSAKAVIDDAGDAEVKAAIAETLHEELAGEPDRLVLLGPGSSVQAVAARLGVEKTLLGIDALLNGKLIGQDLNERAILELLAQHDRHAIVLSPIGAQGFVLGRGNLQLSPAVIRAVGADHLIVIATPAKLARTPVLRFDTGDAALDAELIKPGYVRVLTGYRRRRLVKTAR